MSKPALYTIIALMGAALLGLIGLQAHWIGQAMALNNRSFESTVQTALAKVAMRLEQEDANRFFFAASQGMSLKIQNGMVYFSERKDTMYQEGYVQEDVRVQVHANLDSHDTMWVTQLEQQHSENGTFTKRIDTFKIRETQSLNESPRMVQILTRTLQGAVSPDLSLKDRLDPGHLDSLLGLSLKEQGLNLGYQYLVADPMEGGTVFISEQSQEEDFVNTPYRVGLFQSFGMPGGTASYMLVNFPNKTLHNLGSVGWLLLASVVFTGIILFCFGWTIRTILRQKKVSEMKNDFINNMTHEFKTPLATISLATDALKNPMVREDQTRMDYYTGIIKEENHRMNQQVERVLQIARSEIKLRPTNLDAHQVLTKAVDNIRLHVEQRFGQIQMDFAATNTHIQADEVHLSNLITNLLENANKYSPDTPHISVESWNEEGIFAFSVTDRGRGISRADLEKIFDRFYRVHTGDLHDVKGFGLGLSYVREIVHAHGGEISVKSKLGEGSTFIVRFPLITQEAHPPIQH